MKVFHVLLVSTATLVSGAVAESAAADAVPDADTAVRIAKTACGGALDLPADHHPRWEARQVGDHWNARLLSDYAPYFDNALMSVDVASDGSTTDCIVHVRG